MKDCVSLGVLLFLISVSAVFASCPVDSPSVIDVHDSLAYSPTHQKVYQIWIDHKSALIDSSGKLIVSPFVDARIASDFREGRAVLLFAANDKHAYITDEGRIVPEDEYRAIGDFSEGLASVGKKIAGELKTGFIDKANRLIIDPQFDFAEEFREGLAVARRERDGKLGFIDRTGKWVITPQFNNLGGFGDGLAAVDLCGSCSYMDRSGKRAFTATFQECSRFADGVAKVRFDKDSWGFIDKTGRTLATAYSHNNNLDGASEGLMVSVRKDKSDAGFVDLKGNWVVQPVWGDVHPFSEGLAAVFKDDKWGFVDHTGKVVIPVQFCDDADIGNFQEGLAFVCDAKTHKFGFIDHSGHWAIEPRFLVDNRGECPGGHLCGFEGPLAQVYAPGRMGYINHQGKWIWSEKNSDGQMPEPAKKPSQAPALR